jgi:CheY-like chemotaxis protein
MAVLEVGKPVWTATEKIPHEFKAIAEEAVILVLIMIAASSADEVAKRLLGAHMSPVIGGLLTASLYVLCAIYAIAVLSTMKRLVIGPLLATRSVGARFASRSTRGKSSGAETTVASAVPLSVLVVDDDRLVAMAIRHMLALDARIGSISTAVSPQAAIAKVISGPESEAPDVILLDVNYTGSKKKGVDYLKELREVAPHAKLVVMSICPEYARAAVSNDADGFIWKNEGAVDFAEAVVDAAHESFVTSKSVTRELLKST